MSIDVEMKIPTIMPGQLKNKLSTTEKTTLIDRLSSISALKDIPREELQWLVHHGRVSVKATGTIVVAKGMRTDELNLLLSGRMAIRVDRGAGPRLVGEWQTGEVVGLLPYSRMSSSPGDVYIEETAEALSIHERLFPEMTQQCPSFTAYTVHSMLDRARNFTSSDWQDEKMLSLGKLAAGLAHELNNPASVTVRDAKLLIAQLEKSDAAWQALIAARLSDEQLQKIITLRATCLARSDATVMTAIEKADHQDEISQWLMKKELDPASAVSLTDIAVSITDLDKLSEIISNDKLDVVLEWITANGSTRHIAEEIGQASGQIYRLVNSMKKFTYMDSLAEEEIVDLQTGIRDTLLILASKVKAKNAEILIEIDADLPHIYANGSDLNQVWYSLLDNALDAISPAGKIRIKASTERNRVAVCISDDGPGIAPDVLPKIFDPFFTTKPPGQGTGLGLDITRRLLRRNQADISVQSRPGLTTFSVSLSAHADS